MVHMNAQWVIASEWNYAKTLAQMQATAQAQPKIQSTIQTFYTSGSIIQGKLMYAFAMQAGLMLALGSLASGQNIEIKLCIQNNDDTEQEIKLF